MTKLNLQKVADWAKLCRADNDASYRNTENAIVIVIPFYDIKTAKELIEIWKGEN